MHTQHPGGKAGSRCLLRACGSLDKASYKPEFALEMVVVISKWTGGVGSANKIAGICNSSTDNQHHHDLHEQRVCGDRLPRPRASCRDVNTPYKLCYQLIYRRLHSGMLSLNKTLCEQMSRSFAPFSLSVKNFRAFSRGLRLKRRSRFQALGRK